MQFIFLLISISAGDPVQQCAKSLADSEASCDNGEFRIELPLCALQHKEVNPADLFMNSPQCRGVVVGDVIVFDAQTANCAVEPARNGTDWFVFDATIKCAPLSNSVITRVAEIELDFSCAIDTKISVNAAINVKLGYILVDFNEEIGHFNIKMDVFNSSDFANPAHPDHLFQANEKVFIGFTNQDSPLSVALKKCVATPEISPRSGPEYVIIEDMCPTEPTTKILSSGAGNQAKIEFEAFEFKGYSEFPISVVCEISICEAEDCNVCDQTTTTSTTTTAPTTVTFVDSEPMKPTHGRLLSEYTQTLNFKLSIDIQCSHNHPVGQPYNILHVTKGDNYYGELGDRLFAVWENYNGPGLRILFLSRYVDSDCNDGEWNTYSLTHRQIPNNPSRMKSSLKKDGVEIASNEMDTSKADEVTNMQMKVYLSSPWNPAASEYNVRNFFLERYEDLRTTS